MFKRITNIENLARFEKPESCRSCEFKRWNVIFADNGRGKSTLTCMFRSVGENEPHHLLARQTLGQTHPPKLELLFTDSSGTNIQAQFNGTSWSQTPEPIMVFDQDFVDTNVHFGGKVEYAQKRGLYEVFVGSQTGTLVEQIGIADEAVRLLNPKISETNARILPFIRSDQMSVQQFIALPKEEGLDAIVDGLEKQLETIENKTTILKAPELQKVEYLPPDLQKLSAVLQTSVKTLGEDVKAAMKAQLINLEEPDAETWIKRGNQLLEHTEGDCPFCGQHIDPGGLVDHYSEYFNKEYTEALNGLHSYRTELIDDLNIGSLITLGRLIAENDNRIAYWKKQTVKDIEEASFEIDSLQSVLTELSSQLSEILNNKLQDPLTVLEIPQQLSDTIDSLTTKLKQLDSYNETVKANNLKIAAFKAELMKSDDVLEVKKQLHLAKDKRSRHRDSIDKLCTEYVRLTGDKKKLEGEKSALRETLDNSSEAIIAAHQDEINECLKNSGASFRIKQIENTHGGGKPNSTFVIEINGESINADADAADAPNLKTALSAGDKTTLAFAFYVSHVSQASNLSDAILVIDDPISSLDYGRRSYTLNKIFELFNLSAQGIVLSHDPDFLHGVWQKMGISPSDRSSFQVKRTGARASKIEKWDVEKQAENEQKVRMQKLGDFVNLGLQNDQELKDIVILIRPTLEHAYKAIYPKEFPSADSLGMFIQNVGLSPEAYLVNIKTRIPKISQVNDYVTPYSSHAPGNTVPDLNEGELKTHVEAALELLRS